MTTENMTKEELLSDFTNYLDSLNSLLKANEEAKKLYYGFEIIDGQLRLNPEIMLIGINPGKGNSERNYDVNSGNHEKDYISYIDSFYPGYRYQLAEATIGLLIQSGLSKDQVKLKLENDWVRTNIYPIITDNPKDIKKCINLLGNKKFDEFWDKSVNFCINLIKTLKPKIVIFEGKSAYDAIVVDYYGINGTWNKQFDFGFYNFKESDSYFLGYKRSYNNILSNPVEFAKRLKEIIQ
jgi:hypothetical protein